MKTLFFSIVLLLATISLAAQDLLLYPPDLTNYPEISMDFILQDSDGKQLKDILPGDFIIKENGIQRQVISLTCPQENTAKSISAVLMIDCSESMEPDGLAKAKSAAHAWIDAMPEENAECAVASFNRTNSYHQDFTNEKVSLHNAVNRLKAFEGTNYNAAFIDEPAGALIIAEKAKYQKVIVLLTDGQAKGDETGIIKNAKEIDAVIYCVSLGSEMPKILKHTSEATGGLWFENVTTQEQAEKVYQKIQEIAIYQSPCTVSWMSEGCDININLEASAPDYYISEDMSYQKNLKILPKIEFEPVGIIEFGELEPGAALQKKIKLRSVNDDISISSITPSSLSYSIVDYGGPTPPFLLAEGADRELTIEFAPGDSSYLIGRFDIISDACAGKQFYAKGGFYGLIPKEPQLKLIYPNGGEKIYAGSNVTVEWEGTLPSDSLMLEFSLDSGATWTEISNKAYGDAHIWTAPDTTSDSCLMRVRQIRDPGFENPVYREHVNKIYDFSWSPDGSQIISAALGDSIRIWDTESLQTTKVLEQGLGRVNAIDWSPQGDRFVVCGAYYIVVRDIATGDTLLDLTYKENRRECYDAEFSPDGKKLAYSELFGGIKIFDLENNALLYEMDVEPYERRVNDLEWRPDGLRLAAVFDNDEIVIFNAETGNALKTLLFSEKNRCLSWSPDGGEIASVANGEEPVEMVFHLWNAVRGREISNFTFPGLRSAIDWNPMRGKVAFGSSKNIPLLSVYDRNLDTTTEHFVGHDRYVNSTEWAPDGVRLASGSDDGTIRIWLPGNELQSDVSDSIWSIMKFETSVKNVDMEDVFVGSQKDTLVEAFLNNQESIPLRIDSLKLVNDFSGSFSVLSQNYPYRIPANSDLDIAFSYSPAAVGPSSATIAVFTDKGVFRSLISGNGIENPLDIITRLVDFGDVRVGNAKDTIIALVKNNSAIPLTIASTENFGPDKQQFRIISGGGSFLLQPGEISGEMEIEFAPFQAGRSSGGIAFFTNAIERPAIAQLFGKGLPLPFSGMLIPGDIEGETGEIVRLPVYLKDVEITGNPEISGFETTLSFNSTLLYPVRGVPRGYLLDGKRFIRLELPAEPDKSGLLAEIPLYVTLGNAEESELKLDSSSIVGGTGEIRDSSALFTLLGICREGGERLIGSGNNLFLLQNTPNPATASTMIEFGILEKGFHEIVIFNIFGQKVLTPVSGYFEPGEYSAELETEWLPAGTYFYSLRSPTAVLTRAMKIID